MRTERARNVTSVQPISDSRNESSYRPSLLDDIRAIFAKTPRDGRGRPIRPPRERHRVSFLEVPDHASSRTSRLVVAPRPQLLPENDPRRREAFQAFQAVLDMMKVSGLTVAEQVQLKATLAAVEKTIVKDPKKLTWRNRIDRGGSDRAEARPDILQDEGIPIEGIIAYLHRMHAAAKDRATRKRLGALLTTLIRNSSPYADLPGRGDSLRIAARQRQEAYFIGSGDMEGDWERAGKILRDRVELLIFPHEYTIDLARALPKEGSLAFRRFPWFYQNLMRQTIQALRAQTWFTRVTLVDRNAECSLIFHGVAEFGHTNSAQILI